MKLYYSALSPYSHKVLMAFYEKGVEFEGVPTNLADPQARNNLRELWAMGKLPFLLAGEMGLGESSNIVEWLDQEYPERPLISKDPAVARQIRYWDRIADQYINANAITLFFQSLRPVEKRDEERITTARNLINGAYTLLEKTLAESAESSQFWLNGGPTMGAISLGCSLAVSQGGVPFADKPNMLNLLARIQERPTYIRAKEGSEQAAAQIVAAFTQKSE